MKDRLQALLERAGISINGAKPYDIQVHNPNIYKRILMEPSLGSGEGFMDGWWTCERLDELFFRLARCFDLDTFHNHWKMRLIRFINFIINQQSPLKSQKVAKKHYNLDNEMYQYMLGDSMAYTCGYWKDAKNLDEAQYAKYDLICRKLKLQSGEKILELGCGWGGFAKYAAEKYGCEVIAVNISSEQIKFARDHNAHLPIQFLLCDYRDANVYNPKNILFDKIVSIGLCEHIGYKNYRRFLKIAHKNLKPEGLFLLHTIGRNNSVNFVDPWTNKYIFPQGMLPSIKQLSSSMENLFVVEDLHNFGADYDKTLMAWHENFVRNWDKISARFDDRFYRMWNYYLLTCAGVFRAREMQLWQFVLSPKGMVNGYESIR